ncbi:MAG TPA: HAMP domain-containing sensor histidine kinase [Candidatus Limnocylindrales bacterium]|jgi:two-component system sensor histidine kinase MtrB|nr:HAMP domain-containing sensor histidine kinase [Candidatus Limnocylindrales bacterium]
MRWPRGVRARLAGALVLLVAVTAVVLGVGATLYVDARLHDQVLQDAAAQARFDLSVTVPGRQLPDDPTVEDITNSGLTETFLRRGFESVIDLGGGETVKSSDTLADLLERLPPDVPARVGRGELAYAWINVAGRPSLVVGGLAPGGGLAVYFVRSVESIDVAVDQLRTVLLIGALLLVLVALLTARMLARGILAPIEEAGETAERIERGDLLARVPVTSHDEFGIWADRFNRMTDTLAESIRRLEAAQHQNRRFVADVAHELRTPLTALVAEASIVREHLDELPPESRRAAEMLVNDVGRLRTLVEELMELSRFDANAEQVSLEKVDLGRLIETVRTARSPKARFAPPERPVVIEADPRRLERILGNFLDNAKEHAGDADVEIELDGRRFEVVIAVSDRGPGVPPDRLELIFDRFTKVDPSRSGGSSGLGLAIAAEHAALMGGYLQAMNREDGGLRLELVLPRDVAGSLRGGDGMAT